MNMLVRIMRGGVTGLIFVVVLVVTAHLIGRANPFSGVPTVSEKWDYWKAHKDEFDTIFLGTSRTYRGIVPTVFDPLTAANGVPTKTFNLGMDAMFPPEDAFVAEQFLRDPPKNLKWVFIETAVFMEDFEDRDPDSVRSVYWHDLPRTQLCSRALLWPKRKSEKWKKWLKTDKGKPSIVSVVATHWRLFFTRSLNMGRGSTNFSQWIMNRAPKSMKAIGDNLDGFKPMLAKTFENSAQAEEYENTLKQRQEKPAKIIPMNSYAEESLMRVVKRVRELGAKPIVFLAPTTGHLRGHPADALKIPVLDFCDVVNYPELFEPAVRTDNAHVNEQGAKLFTTRLAEKFIELAQSRSSAR